MTQRCCCTDGPLAGKCRWILDRCDLRSDCRSRRVRQAKVSPSVRCRLCISPLMGPAQHNAISHHLGPHPPVIITTCCLLPHSSSLPHSSCTDSSSTIRSAAFLTVVQQLRWSVLPLTYPLRAAWPHSSTAALSLDAHAAGLLPSPTLRQSAGIIAASLLAPQRSLSPLLRPDVERSHESRSDPLLCVSYGCIETVGLRRGNGEERWQRLEGMPDTFRSAQFSVLDLLFVSSMQRSTLPPRPSLASLTATIHRARFSLLSSALLSRCAVLGCC